MYKVMIVSADEDLLKELKNMRVWGEISEFEISKTVNSGDDAYRELCRERYDFVICETHIKGMDSLEFLRRANEEKLGGHIAFFSRYADFEYARQGIILDAFDYFVLPFQEIQFYSAFRRIKNKADKNNETGAHYSEEIIKLFESRDSGIYVYISGMLKEIYKNSADIAAAENILNRIYKNVVDEIFSRNEWLDLYKSNQSFCAEAGIPEGITYDKYFSNKITELFEEYCELFPAVNNEKINEVILHILNNPESDLKQKTIASELYINSSYLSTVFSVQTQLRFIDYLTMVKLKRAGWLLQNTSMRVTEIAERLDYKDIGYFSRMFKKQYGVTPTEYRIPDDYTYQI